MTTTALPPAALASMVAERMRRTSRDGDPALSAAETASCVQRVLEEGGVDFSISPTLVDLKGYVIASERGAEITISERLDSHERLQLYAHLLAHALVGTVDARPQTVFAPLWSAASGTPFRPRLDTGRPLFVHLEYLDGRGPTGASPSDRRVQSLTALLADAILRGHVDVTPRYAFLSVDLHHATDSGVHTSPRRGLRAKVGRLFLDLCHQTSLALFWRSTRYRRLRASRPVTVLAHQLDGIVRAYLPGAA